MTAVALAHDYLTQRGGAERVVLTLARTFPDAPVHTSLYDPVTCYPEYAGVDVRMSPLNRSGLLRRHHRLAYPLLPRTFAAMVIDAEVVVVSSSGWAHGVATTGRKIVYCHAPARWLYQPQHYLRHRGPAARTVVAASRASLRAWDTAAAHSADRYLVNSTVVRDRVRAAYGIEADVVHPPHAIVAEQAPQHPVAGITRGYALCIARLQAYKNVDRVIAALHALPDLRLVVVGTGPQRQRLQQMAGPNVTFVGGVSDPQLHWLYANAAVLVGASHEDFGLTPVEAAAFGVPTAALRDGGYLDTVIDGRTGRFFDHLDARSMAAAIAAVAGSTWDRGAITCHAERFAEHRFAARMRAIVAAARPSTTAVAVVV